MENRPRAHVPLMATSAAVTSGLMPLASHNQKVSIPENADVMISPINSITLNGRAMPRLRLRNHDTIPPQDESSSTHA